MAAAPSFQRTGSLDCELPFAAPIAKSAGPSRVQPEASGKKGSALPVAAPANKGGFRIKRGCFASKALLRRACRQKHRQSPRVVAEIFQGDPFQIRSARPPDAPRHMKTPSQEDWLGVLFSVPCASVGGQSAPPVRFGVSRSAQTMTAPELPMASLVEASPSSMELCGSPDGIIGKQFSCFSTRQSKITGPS